MPLLSLLFTNLPKTQYFSLTGPLKTFHFSSVASSGIRSTQGAICCQCAGCVNICDEELLQLAGADASCVDPWICLSHRSAGPQCCAAQQNCRASCLSSHQNITLLPYKLLTANTWAPQCSGDKEEKHPLQPGKESLVYCSACSNSPFKSSFFFLFF